MRAFPVMPATLEELKNSVEGIQGGTLRHLTRVIRESGDTLERLVDVAERLIGSLPWRWPVLDRWNEWCLANGVRFAMWEPRPGGLDRRARLAVLVHTVMMGGEERNTRSYQDSGVVASAEILPTDECPVCALHAGQVIRLTADAARALPPFHPGCRCTTLAVLDDE